MASYFEIACGIAALLLALYYYATSTFNFWKSRGVAGPQPLPFLGTTKDIMFARISMPEYIRNIYMQYKNEPMIGLYMRRSPLLILNDPELLKDVLIRDFSKFSDRGTRVFEKTEPLSAHLFNLESERWRPLRARLSPIFTSGKLKEMFYLIVECAEHLEKYLDSKAEKDGPIECRELTAKFATDVIGTCAFGIDMNAMADEDSEFRKMGREVFAVNLANTIRFKLRLFMPALYDWLGWLISEKKLNTFFTNVVTDTIKYRKENKIKRPDFINMLMELKENPEKLEHIELTDSLLSAQAFVFFVAGFETSSSTMSNALYELARNQDIQTRLREEIRQCCDKKGQLKYEDIKQMEYLDKVFKETLRMYPAAAFLMRKAMSNYTFNGTKVSIPKGTLMWIPVFAIHRDPDIYPNPDVFDPERFNKDAIETRHAMNYMPFGDGPRNCIGARFAVYQTKLGLVTILRNHKVEVCEKTKIPYEFDPGAVLLAPKGGIHLKFTKV